MCAAAIVERYVGYSTPTKEGVNRLLGVNDTSRDPVSRRANVLEPFTEGTDKGEDAVLGRLPVARAGGRLDGKVLEPRQGEASGLMQIPLLVAYFEIGAVYFGPYRVALPADGDNGFACEEVDQDGRARQRQEREQPKQEQAPVDARIEWSGGCV